MVEMRNVEMGESATSTECVRELEPQRQLEPSDAGEHRLAQTRVEARSAHSVGECASRKILGASILRRAFSGGTFREQASEWVGVRRQPVVAELMERSQGVVLAAAIEALIAKVLDLFLEAQEPLDILDHLVSIAQKKTGPYRGTRVRPWKRSQCCGSILAPAAELLTRHIEKGPR